MILFILLIAEITFGVVSSSDPTTTTATTGTTASTTSTTIYPILSGFPADIVDENKFNEKVSKYFVKNFGDGGAAYLSNFTTVSYTTNLMLAKNEELRTTLGKELDHIVNPSIVGNVVSAFLGPDDQNTPRFRIHLVLGILDQIVHNLRSPEHILAALNGIQSGSKKNNRELANTEWLPKIKQLMSEINSAFVPESSSKIVGKVLKLLSMVSLELEDFALNEFISTFYYMTGTSRKFDKKTKFFGALKVASDICLGKHFKTYLPSPTRPLVCKPGYGDELIISILDHLVDMMNSPAASWGNLLREMFRVASFIWASFHPDLVYNRFDPDKVITLRRPNIPKTFKAFLTLAAASNKLSGPYGLVFDYTTSTSSQPSDTAEDDDTADEKTRTSPPPKSAKLPLLLRILVGAAMNPEGQLGDYGPERGTEIIQDSQLDLLETHLGSDKVKLEICRFANMKQVELKPLYDCS